MNLHDLHGQAESIGMLQHFDEIRMATGFIAGLRPERIMEIGSWKGGVFSILQSLVPQDGLALSLDLDAYNDTDVQKRNELFRSWGPHVKTVLGDSHKMETFNAVSDLLGDARIDFLFIDGDHSYEGVKQDYFMYGQFVRRGGTIAFHDIVESDWHISRGCEVGKFWNELRGDKVEINLRENWGGWGFIRKS